MVKLQNKPMEEELELYRLELQFLAQFFFIND